ncbi:hypothetical protein DM02DRAFT_674455 [Periconia macrospinosa]|uniref:Uncharacterized protein n=1 Tax=Periconia macrospinosa TaxID=97972 RepID=A0A2V1DFX2_9PLEO|nr:hypothetical protein DM02DRAFT_674455 [Periconia macrospinosa]
MKFSAIAILAAPLLALAAPADLTAEAPKDIEKRVVPGCVIHHDWDGEWTEWGLARYRTKFTAKEIPSSDVCNVPYFNCLSMSNRQCWTEGDVTIVDASFAKGAGWGSYQACLQNGMRQWAKDNGCKCEGAWC